MSTIKDAPAPRLSPYMQCLYGLFNLLLLGVLVLSFLSFQGNFAKSAGLPISSNGTISPSSQPQNTVFTQVPAAMEAFRYTPDRFSSCSMDSCFDYTRCDNMEELLVYHYDTESSPAWQFKDALTRSPFYTTDPEKACLFLVTVDRRVGSPALESLPFWNNGLNHVVISTVDKSRHPNPEATGMASTMTTITHQSVYRAGFDLSVPLPQKRFYPEIQKLKALERKYFLTFKGARFSQEFAPGGGIRNSPILSGMHNGEDIIVATTCQQVNFTLVVSLKSCSTFSIVEAHSLSKQSSPLERLLTHSCCNCRFRVSKCTFEALN